MKITRFRKDAKTVGDVCAGQCFFIIGDDTTMYLKIDYKERLNVVDMRSGAMCDVAPDIKVEVADVEIIAKV